MHLSRGERNLCYNNLRNQPADRFSVFKETRESKFFSYLKAFKISVNLHLIYKNRRVIRDQVRFFMETNYMNLIQRTKLENLH